MSVVTMFKPGGAGGPGRPKGSRNKLAESFLDALHRDFLEHGVEAIAAARAESPLGYVKMVASLLPQKVQVETSDLSRVSDDELLAIIRGADNEPAFSDDAEPGGAVH